MDTAYVRESPSPKKTAAVASCILFWCPFGWFERGVHPILHNHLQSEWNINFWSQMHMVHFNIYFKTLSGSSKDMW